MSEEYEETGMSRIVFTKPRKTGIIVNNRVPDPDRYVSVVESDNEKMDIQRMPDLPNQKS